MSQRITSALMVSIASLFFAYAAWAQSTSIPGQAGPGQGGPEQITTRIYDVRDLILVVQDYPLTGTLLPPTQIGEQPGGGIQSGSPGGGGSLNSSPNSPPAPPPSSWQELVTDVTSTVAPESWRTNGGAYGVIAYLNGDLIVTQSEQNQQAITNLFAELRKARAATVRVRADWVVLKPGELGTILKNGPDDKSAVPEVSRDALDKLPNLHYSGQISCFSGQTVHLASGAARTMVLDQQPTVATGSVGYAASTQIVQYGVVLQVVPTVAGGVDSATLDLMSVASDEPDLPTTRPTISESDPEVDRFNSVVQHFHTTVQVPLNKPVLVGGMTMEPGSGEAKGEQLYLVVEADTGNP